MMKKLLCILITSVILLPGCTEGLTAKMPTADRQTAEGQIDGGQIAEAGTTEKLSVLLSAEDISKLTGLPDGYQAKDTGAASSKVQYIRTDGYHEDAEYPIITVIKSKSELDGYYGSYEGLYDFSHREMIYSDSTVGFIDAIEKYSDDYFENNILVLVLLEESSGSVRHEVKSIDDGVIKIVSTMPEIGTDDMAEWHIIIEISKSDASDAYSLY